jgi:hypothetical protein
MEWTTASASARTVLYSDGCRMLALCQETALDHEGAVGDAVTADQVGSPERLW